MTGSVDYAVLIEDIANLADMYLKESGLLSMVDDLQALRDVPDLMRQFGKLVPILNDLEK